jgi:hypothetical protein
MAETPHRERPTVEVRPYRSGGDSFERKGGQQMVASPVQPPEPASPPPPPPPEKE